MADNVRAERRRAQAAAPAAQHERRLAAARAWKEQKRKVAALVEEWGLG